VITWTEAAGTSTVVTVLAPRVTVTLATWFEVLATAIAKSSLGELL